MSDQRQIEGVLILPLDQQDDTELRIDPAGVELPDSCPVTIGFDVNRQVGTATLYRDGVTIRATVTLYGEGLREVERLYAHDLARHLAAGARIVKTSSDIREVTISRLSGVGLVDRHVDTNQPPWCWVNEDPVAEDAPAPTQPVPASIFVTIRSWLPAHTHQVGPTPFSPVAEWTWTTPAGTWYIRSGGPFFGPRSLILTGPGGKWELGKPDETALRRLRGVLVTLGAIDDADKQPAAEPAATTHLLGPTGIVCGFPAHAHLDHNWSKDLKLVTCGDCLRIGAVDSG